MYLAGSNVFEYSDQEQFGPLYSSGVFRGELKEAIEDRMLSRIKGRRCLIFKAQI